MAINPPVDATQTPEWAALQKHYDELQVEGVSLKKWFAEDAERVEKLSFDAGDLHFDLSKNLIKPETLQLFANLAKAVKLDERTKAMYTGVHINNTEDRAVLHTALRRPAEDEGKYIVDGQDTVKDVREVLGVIGEPLLEADAFGLQLIVVLLQCGPLRGLGGVNRRIDGHGV